jgi:uncharacterized protein YjiS (DUF1127 family)
MLPAHDDETGHTSMHTIAIAGRWAGAWLARRPLAGRIAAVGRAVFAAVERSQRRRAVAALSDHLLHDLGLTRADLLNVESRLVCARCDDGHIGRRE